MIDWSRLADRAIASDQHHCPNYEATTYANFFAGSPLPVALDEKKYAAVQTVGGDARSAYCAGARFGRVDSPAPPRIKANGRRAGSLIAR